jgi:hypothetical protein
MISLTMQLIVKILKCQKRFIILEKKWLKDNLDVNDDPYEVTIFVYNKEMDQLMEANIN